MMNGKLQGNFEKRLAEYLKSRFRKVLPLTQICALLALLFAFLNCIFTGEAVQRTITWGILAAIVPLLLWLIAKRTPSGYAKAKNKILISFFKEKIYIIIFSVIININYLSGFRNNHSKCGSGSEITFLGGIDWIWVLQIFRMIFTSWHTHMFFLMTLTIPFCIQSWILSLNSSEVNIQITFRVLIFIINTTLLSFVSDKDIKQMFYMKSNLEDKDAIHKEVLNQIPESILLIGNQFELKYFNECFKKQYLGAKDKLELYEFLDCFTHLKEISCTNSDYSPSLPAKSTMKLILQSYCTSSEPYNDSTNNHIAINQSCISDISKVGRLQLNTPQLSGGTNVKTEIYLDENDFSRCRTFRGHHKGYTRSQESTNSAHDQEDEVVEIKLIPTNFSGELTILLVIRNVPEVLLLEKLDRAAKYKDEILASVSHELRTPINSNINLLNEAIKSPKVPDEIKSDLLDPAYKSGKLLLNIVNDILDISQIKEQKLKLVSQVTDLRKVITDCHYLFEHQCKQKGVRLSVNINNSVPAKIRTDPNRLTQVILNLLSNAYKFTFDGEITIKTEMAHNGLIKISVNDTGIGIKEQDQEKLMKKFEKIDLGDKAAFNSTGAGLGLSIANSLAAMLGPTNSSSCGLKFNSKWKMGTTVSFLLRSRSVFNNSDRVIDTSPSSAPTNEKQTYSESEEDSSEYIEEDKGEVPIYALGASNWDQMHTYEDCKLKLTVIASETRNATHSRPRSIRSKKQILHECSCPKVMVVDDDAFNVLTLNTMLSSMGVTFESALSGIECLKILTNASKCCHDCLRFSLIIMDGNMPVKDGFQTTKELLEWNATSSNPWVINIIGCTAYCVKEKWQEFIDAGAIEHLIKPLNKIDLEKLLLKYDII